MNKCEHFIRAFCPIFKFNRHLPRFVLLIITPFKLAHFLNSIDAFAFCIHILNMCKHKSMSGFSKTICSIVQFNFLRIVWMNYIY